MKTAEKEKRLRVDLPEEEYNYVWSRKIIRGELLKNLILKGIRLLRKEDILNNSSQLKQKT